jgi:hypothetical protein
MPYKSFVRIDYDSPEQAATMAARLNGIEPGNAVRARSNGRTVEIAPCNPSVAAIFSSFSRMAGGISRFFDKTPASGNATASA